MTAKKTAGKKAPARKPRAKAPAKKQPAAAAPVAPAPEQPEAGLVEVTNAAAVEMQLTESGSSVDAVAHFLQQEEQAQQQAQQPSEQEQQQQEAVEAARQQGALMMANLLAGGAAQGVNMFWGVELQPKQLQTLSEKLAPVLAKSGGGMPEWLVPYKEELDLGICVAGIGFGVWREVQKNKAAEIAAARQRQQQQQQQQGDRPSMTLESLSLDADAPREAA